MVCVGEDSISPSTNAACDRDLGCVTVREWNLRAVITWFSNIAVVIYLLCLRLLMSLAQKNMH